jgi:hypothetical protein
MDLSDCSNYKTLCKAGHSLERTASLNPDEHVKHPEKDSSRCYDAGVVDVSLLYPSGQTLLSKRMFSKILALPLTGTLQLGQTDLTSDPLVPQFNLQNSFRILFVFSIRQFLSQPSERQPHAVSHTLVAYRTTKGPQRRSTGQFHSITEPPDQGKRIRRAQRRRRTWKRKKCVHSIWKTTYLLDDGVVCQGDSLLVQLSVTPLVDELLYTLEVGVTADSGKEIQL